MMVMMIRAILLMTGATESLKDPHKVYGPSFLGGRLTVEAFL